MLVALLTFLILGGGNPMGISDFIADMEGSMKTVVINEERRNEALNTIKAMKTRMKDHNESVKPVSKLLQKELTEHEVRNDEIDKLWDQHIDLISNTTHELIALRYQLRDQLTRDEWDQMFSE